MGLQLPGWLTEPAGWIGLEWPQADETLLLEAAYTWLGYAGTAQPINETAHRLVEGILEDNRDDVSEAVQDWWNSFDGPRQRMSADAVAATAIGLGCLLFAVTTLVMKLFFIAQLIALIIQVGVLLAGVVTAGLAGGAIAAARFIYQRLIKQFLDLVRHGIARIFKAAKKLLRRSDRTPRPTNQTVGGMPNPHPSGRKPSDRGPSERGPSERRPGESVADDLHDANPNRHLPDRDPGYDYNCAYSVTAYELRRRGYDVYAGPATPNEVEIGGVPFADFVRFWGKNDFDGQVTNFDDLAKAFMEMDPGARGIYTIHWKDGGGHYSIIENVDGRIRLLDPQTNTAGTAVYRALKSGALDDFSYIRVDDLPTPDFEKLHSTILRRTTEPGRPE